MLPSLSTRKEMFENVKKNQFGTITGTIWNLETKLIKVKKLVAKFKASVNLEGLIFNLVKKIIRSN